MLFEYNGVNPQTLDMINDWYDHLPNGVARSETINELLGLVDQCVTTLNPDESVWRELDNNEEFVEFITFITAFCNIEGIQCLAIFCLDRGLINCQMDFYKEIYEQYMCSEVLTYKRLIS